MDLDLEKINRWLADDPNAEDRAELQELLDKVAAGGPDATLSQAELAERFATEIAFGTAGLRAAMGAGPSMMNEAVVTRATFGLCQVLSSLAGPDFSVVIGFDGRHRSADFARTAAGVVTAFGGRAYLFPKIGPTPLTAFAVNHLDADAGIMITASHNPAPDNGYKVYLGGRIVTGAGRGAQLVSPFDAQIFAAIQAAPGAKAIPCATSGWTVIDRSVEESYVARTVATVDPQESRDLRLVLTSMHGVGAELCETVLARAGFAEVHPVLAQREPDPDFPTVPFPNPEEDGALDLAIEFAKSLAADLIVANDPDADRCAAAIPDPSAPSGWRQLSGDEAGAILGHYAVRHTDRPAEKTVCRSVVSGSLLDKIAASFGVTPKVSLTGFKWIARTPKMIFGYEEAIGNCCDPQNVRDKDGISATLRLCQIAAALKTEGKTLQDLLDELAITHGLHVTAPLTIRVADLAVIAQGMAALRETGLSYLGGEKVTFALDLDQNNPPLGSETSVDAGWENLAKLPPTDGLFFGTKSGSRVIVRPSGTEPKLKCYLEVFDDLGAGTNSSLDDRRAALGPARVKAAAKLAQMKSELATALGI